MPLMTAAAVSKKIPAPYAMRCRALYERDEWSREGDDRRIGRPM